MQCTKCNRTIDDNFNICPYCGQPVQKEINCGICGAVLEKDFKLCPYCGALNESHIKNKEYSNLRLARSKRELIFVSIFAFLSLLLLAINGLIFYIYLPAIEYRFNLLWTIFIFYILITSIVLVVYFFVKLPFAIRDLRWRKKVIKHQLGYSNKNNRVGKRIKH